PAGAVKQGGTYKVFANITENGSGVASASADVNAITTGSTGLTLTFSSGGVTVGGTTYHWVSAEQTATNPLSQGTKAITATATDNVGLVGGPTSFSAIVDNTNPANPTSTIAPTSSGVPIDAANGFVKQGQTYKVFANANDNGSPASGIASVAANVNNVTTGATALQP